MKPFKPPLRRTQASHPQSIARWIRALLAGALVAGCHDVRPTAPQQEPPLTPPVAVTVAAENARPGTSEWLSANTHWANASDLAVWGSPYAANSTDTLSLFVHSRQGAVDVSVFRLGWYSGQGGRLVWRAKSVMAGPQPACSAPGSAPVQCPWTETVRIPLTAGWTPGIYVARTANASSMVAYYAFVVHGTAAAKVTVVIPQFTWQAYNSYGGSSFYTRDSTGTLYHSVSFDRPYVRGGGSSNLLRNEEGFELKVARWLERIGIDVAYISDVDLAMQRPLPAGTKVLIFAGHDEYWTWDEFSYVQSLRDAGTHLMFLAANAAYWNVRLGQGWRAGDPTVIVCYKSSTDPEATSITATTTRFRDSPLRRPEAALYGISYFEVADTGRLPLFVSDTAMGTDAAAFLSAAGIFPGDSISGFVGGEGDRPTTAGSPANLQVLFRSPDRTTAPLTNHYYYTTFFVAPSGAGVFAAGNNYFARGLDDLFDPGDSRVQRLTLTVLQWMLAR